MKMTWTSIAIMMLAASVSGQRPELPSIGSLPSFRPLTIVSIGESYASGEGNPTVRDARFGRATWDESQQCHRSSLSGRTLAFSDLKSLPGVYTTLGGLRIQPLYENFACSGATIAQGLTGRYAGVRGDTTFPILDSQVDQVAAWMQEHNTSVDVLIISVGGNDAAFAEAVAACLNPLKDCVKDATLLVHILSGNPERPHVVGLNGLKDAFDELATEIEAKIKPKHVFITSYPDPVHDEKGQLCGSVDENFVIFPDESEPNGFKVYRDQASEWQIGGSMANLNRSKTAFLLNTLLTGLNAAVKAAADRHGWNFISGMMELTAPHGYCSSDSWFVSLRQSFDRQGDVGGTAHPNEKGHKAYKYLIEKAVVEKLNLPKAPPIEFISGPQVLNRLNNGTLSELNTAIARYKKAVRIELAPTANDVEMKLEYSTSQAAFAMDDPESVTMQRVPGFSTRMVFAADVPGSQNLIPGEHFQYRIVVQYKRPQETIKSTYIGGKRTFNIVSY